MCKISNYSRVTILFNYYDLHMCKRPYVCLFYLTLWMYTCVNLDICVYFFNYYDSHMCKYE
ncbi:hypothetical protein Hdeb2414_s0007g00225501 [Helianthus debilis subsp. tardiflorus]